MATEEVLCPYEESDIVHSAAGGKGAHPFSPATCGLARQKTKPSFDLVKELQKDTNIETLCDDGVYRKLSVLAADEIKRLKDALVDCWAFSTLVPGFIGSREVSTLVMKVLGDEIGPIYARREQERRAEQEQQ